MPGADEAGEDAVLVPREVGAWRSAAQLRSELLAFEVPRRRGVRAAVLVGSSSRAGLCDGRRALRAGLCSVLASCLFKLFLFAAVYESCILANVVKMAL